MSKLTKEQVKEIINLCLDSNNKRVDISKKYNISHSTLFDIINNKSWRQIERPSTLLKKEQISILPQLTIKQQEIITGSLLGDGFLHKPDKQNSNFRKNQSAINLEYLLWHIKELHPYSKLNLIKGKNYGIIHNEYRNIIDRNYNIIHYYYEYRSINHSIFNELEKIWYLRDNNGEYIFNKKGWRIKCIPQKINLTPLTMAIWFCDDGSNSPRNRLARFCTDNFQKDEVQKLVENIRDTFNVSCNLCLSNKKPEIYIQAKSYIDFINIIKPHINFKCLLYKTNIDEYILPNKYTKSDFTGVRLQGKWWRAFMTRQNKSFCLGKFKTKEEAIATRKKAIQERVKSGDCPYQFMRGIGEENEEK